MSIFDTLDSLAEALGNSDGQTIEEVEAELIEQMGEEAYKAAKARALNLIEECKRRLSDQDNKS